MQSSFHRDQERLADVVAAGVSKFRKKFIDWQTPVDTLDEAHLHRLFDIQLLKNVAVQNAPKPQHGQPTDTKFMEVVAATEMVVGRMMLSFLAANQPADVAEKEQLMACYASGLVRVATLALGAVIGCTPKEVEDIEAAYWRHIQLLAEEHGVAIRIRRPSKREDES